MPEPVILSWSGGKDSALALAALRSGGEFEVVALLTSVTAEYERVSVHGVRRTLLHAQAVALDIELHEMVLPRVCTNEAYEAAFAQVLTELRALHPAARRLAFGDLFLEDVRRYREALLEGSGVTPLFPIWGMETGPLARRFVDEGYDARLVCVDTEALGAEFAGRRFSHELLDALPATVDPCGENGEFHTFVANGPVFRQPVPYTLGERVLRDERFAYRDLLPCTPAVGGEGA